MRGTMRVVGLGLWLGISGMACLVGATTLARLPAPGLVLHVAPGGNDVALGTLEQPFATLEGARDAVRKLKRSGGLPRGGVVIQVHEGEYAVRAPFRLESADSGTEEAPVVYRAAAGEQPRFAGGVRLAGWRSVTDAEVLGRLPESARGKVMEAGLAEAGVTNVLPLALGGFGSGRGFRTHPVMELYVDGRPMVLARWPNEGFVKTEEVLGALTLKAWDNKPGAREGWFRYAGDRPSRWAAEPEAWVYGYWFWDWADSYERIERMDVAAREIRLAEPWHGYGYRRGQRFYGLNLLCELDAPGEWYLDRARGRVLLYPPEGASDWRAELSTAAFPLVEMDGVSHVRLEGLLWDLGCSDGVTVKGGAHCALVGCTVRRLAGDGVKLDGGVGHAVVSCNVHTLGRGGLVVRGGNRRTLEPSRHLVENSHIHHLSRIDHTYTPGLLLEGVGHRIRHNLIHDVASSAMRVGGNDHLVERNEVHHVVLESDDQGGVDMWGNPSYRGVVFRHNYWHHMGNWDRRGEEPHTGQAGIRLDDAISGVWIEGNVFQRCATGEVGFGGVQIHGGKDNRVSGNLFVDCSAAVSFTPWGDARWRSLVARFKEDPAIDQDLYRQRYPDWARLLEGHDVNHVTRNVAVRCGSVLRRAPATVQAQENLELPMATELVENPDGRLDWREGEVKRLGLVGIPFADMGLFPDAYRQRRGGKWTLGSDPE